MNSKNLRKRFDSEYRNFFTKHKIVISMPFVMTWCGDYSMSFSGIHIKQKIPLRMYVWVSFCKEERPEISFGTIRYYDPSRDEFSETELDAYSDYFSRLHVFLSEKYARLTEKYGGIRLRFFSELPQSVGLGFDSVSGMLLISALERLSGTIDGRLVDEIKRKNLADAWREYSDVLGNLFKTSYGYLIDAYQSFPITGNTVASFYEWSAPFVTFGVAQEDGENFDTPLRNGGKAQVYRFGEITGNQSSFQFLSVDYGIAYSGLPVITERVLHSNMHALDWIPKAKNRVSQAFENARSFWSEPIPSFYGDFLKPENRDFEEVYSKLFLVVSLEVFNLMTKLYSKGYSEEWVQSLITVLNKFRYANYVRYFSSTLFGFIAEFENRVRERTGAIISISPNDTTVMGGSVNFVMPLERFRKDVDRALEFVRDDYDGAKIIYQSWVDGQEESWIVFEQDVLDGTYSEYLNDGSVRIKRTGFEDAVSEYEDISKSGEVVLDGVKGKIYVSGEPIWSTELKSQTATIEIFGILLANMGKQIPSQNFPISSYSRNKNEMLSKIIVPFERLVQAKTGKRIDVDCSGGVGEFFLRLAHDGNMDIAIIEKI